MRVVILVTASSKEEARKIANKLVSDKLAACVNIIDGVESLFWWEGKVDRASESLLVIKSKKEKLKSIIKAVRSVHSYTVPEIIALPIVSGDKPYLRWIDESLSR